MSAVAASQPAQPRVEPPPAVDPSIDADAPALAAGPQASGTGEADQGRTEQFLCFALSKHRYAVRIDAVREILEVARMTPLPLMPRFVRGVMNLRGAVVPVIDLGARLGLPVTQVSRRSCVVIADILLPDDQGVQRLGMLVDAVYEVVDLGPADVGPVPRLGTAIDPLFIRAMVRVRGQATAEIDIGSVLDQAALTRLIAEHTERGLAEGRPASALSH